MTSESTASPRLPNLARKTLPSAALVAAGGLGALLRNRFQKSQIFAPDPYPLGMWDAASLGVPFEDVWFESPDGVVLHGWWIGHAKPRGTVLYCHGNSGNITHRVSALEQLRRMRLNVFAFDYRGYGRSEGVPSESGLYLDVRAAHDTLTGELGQPAESVVVFGHSLGGAVAIDLALDRPMAGLIVQSSFTQVRDMARHLFPRSPLYLISRNQFRSIDKVGQLKMPKLFIHGTDDPTVPFAMGEQLFAAAAGPKDFYPVPRAGHNEVHRQAGVRYFWRLQRFGKACLSQAGKP